MAPKAKKEPEPAAEEPAVPKVEDELQLSIVTSDGSLNKKLEALKSITDRPCRVVLYMANVAHATNSLLAQVVQFTPPTCIELSLIYCKELTDLPSLAMLSALKTLNLNMCSNLMALPDSTSSLLALELLDISWCDKLTSLPDLSPLVALTKLDCAGCKNLRLQPLKLPPQVRICVTTATRPLTSRPAEVTPAPLLHPQLKEWNPTNRIGLRKPDHPLLPPDHPLMIPGGTAKTEKPTSLLNR